MARNHALSTRAVGLLWLTSVIAIAAGCTSLSSTRWDTPSSSNEKLAGVPFTLNRPVPTVSVSASGVVPAYSVSFAYVPDDSARYLLDMDPSPLASIQYSINLTNGSLTEASLTTTDQTAAILKSVAAVVGALFTADQGKGPTEPEEVEGFKKLMAAVFTPDHSKKIVDSTGTLACDLSVTKSTDKCRDWIVADKVAWAAMADRMSQFAAKKHLADRFIPMSSEERLLLSNLAWREIESKKGAVANDAPYQQERVALSDKSPEDAKTIDAIGAAVDTNKLKKLADHLQDERKTLRAKEQQNFAIKPLPVLQACDSTASSIRVQSKELEKNTLKFQAVNGALDAIGAETALAIQLAKMSDEDWTQRRIAALNSEIERARYQIKLDTTDTKKLQDAQAELADAKLAKAIALGVKSEYVRSLKVKDLLLTASSAADMKSLRAEYSALDTTMTTAENALKPPKADDPKPDAPQAGALLAARYGVTVDDKCMLAALGDQRPKYVVVIQPVHPDAPPKKTESIGTPTSPVQPGPGTPPVKPADGAKPLPGPTDKGVPETPAPAPLAASAPAAHP